MLQQNNASHWGENDSQFFIEYGHYLIPERETQIEIICNLIPAVEGQQQVIDLGCGAGVLDGAILERFPAYRMLGLDGSPTMIEQAKENLARYGSRFDGIVADLADSAWRSFPWPLHAVVSSLAIHHLDDEQKQQLFRDIYRMLIPGGVFIMADLMMPTTEAGLTLAANMWNEAVRQRSLQFHGDLSVYQHFLDIEWNAFTQFDPDPIDKMSPIASQLKWLEQAGFADVDVHWMRAAHAIFGGVKRHP
jgi:tRNA (cmo5U34)-methyltransferase